MQFYDRFTPETKKAMAEDLIGERFLSRDEATYALTLVRRITEENQDLDLPACIVVASTTAKPGWAVMSIAEYDEYLAGLEAEQPKEIPDQSPEPRKPLFTEGNERPDNDGSAEDITE